LSESGDCRGYEDILFEETQADELFQVPSEAPTMYGLVPFFVVVGAVFFCSGMRGVVLDGSRMPDVELTLNGVEDVRILTRIR